MILIKQINTDMEKAPIVLNIAKVFLFCFFRVITQAVNEPQKPQLLKQTGHMSLDPCPSCDFR